MHEKQQQHRQRDQQDQCHDFLIPTKPSAVHNAPPSVEQVEHQRVGRRHCMKTNKVHVVSITIVQIASTSGAAHPSRLLALNRATILAVLVVVRRVHRSSNAEISHTNKTRTAAENSTIYILVTMSAPSNTKPRLLRRTLHRSTELLATHAFARAAAAEDCALDRFCRHALFEPRLLSIIDKFVQLPTSSVVCPTYRGSETWASAVANAVAYHEQSKCIAVAYHRAMGNSLLQFIRMFSLDGELVRLQPLPGLVIPFNFIHFLDESHLLLVHTATAGVWKSDKFESEFVRWQAVREPMCAAVQHRDDGVVTVYIVDYVGQCIKVLDKTGNEVRSPLFPRIFGNSACDPWHYHPYSIAVHDNALYATSKSVPGDVCVIDLLNSNRIQTIHVEPPNGLHNAVFVQKLCVVTHQDALAIVAEDWLMRDYPANNLSIYRANGSTLHSFDGIHGLVDVCVTNDAKRVIAITASHSSSSSDETRVSYKIIMLHFE